MLLLSTTGAKSGELRTTPVLYLRDGERWVVFASKGGSPENPSWYHNLVATPTAEIEVGTEKFAVEATATSGEERDRLFAEQASRHPQFDEYAERTSRPIPVIALTRTD